MAKGDFKKQMKSGRNLNKDIIIKRGDLCYFNKGDNNANNEGKPGIVVSNNFINEISKHIQVVYLSTNATSETACNVKISGCNHDSVAVCDKIYNVPKSNIISHEFSVISKEMKEIDNALRTALHLHTVNEIEEDTAELITINSSLEAKVERLMKEKEKLESMNEALLNKIDSIEKFNTNNDKISFKEQERLYKEFISIILDKIIK